MPAHTTAIRKEIKKAAADLMDNRQPGTLGYAVQLLAREFPQHEITAIPCRSFGSFQGYRFRLSLRDDIDGHSFTIPTDTDAAYGIADAAQ
jgi:hypothetical protein